MQKNYIIPVFIPELACPNRCIFCDQHALSGQMKAPDVKETTAIIESHLQTINNENAKIEIGFFGGNFTGIPMTQQEEYLKLANQYLIANKIHAIRISTRPDYINEEVLKLLKKFNVQTIELGAQSMNDEVLKQSGRGHTAADVTTASTIIRNAGFSLGLQMMIGLPGDDTEKNISTANKIIALGADNTRIYPLLVIKDTELADQFRIGKYKPLSIEEAVEQTKNVYLLFEKANIKILRVGLHPSEALLNGDNLVAGPFHTSFRELVLSSIWKDIFSPLLMNQNKSSITIHVPENEYNYAIGYSSQNKNLLLQDYKNVIVLRDASLTKRNFYVDID